MELIGEAAQLSLLPDQPPDDIEAVATATELFSNAVQKEPFSLQIWLRYCEYVSSVAEHSAGWPDEERDFLQDDLLPPDTVEKIWEDGLLATKYRINDSHQLWNKWIERKLAGEFRVADIREAFIARLVVPHSTWDDTSQQFSSFLSAHDESNWENSMVQVTELAKPAKAQYTLREPWELKMNAISADDGESLKSFCFEYLEFELIQSKKDPDALPLCYALYERILLLLPHESGLWEDYTVVLSNTRNSVVQRSQNPPELLSVFQRALDHCASAMSLWSRYMVKAEADEIDDSEIEAIMELAVNNLDDIPMGQEKLEQAVILYSAWCGYLKRHSSGLPATSAIESAINKVTAIGKDPSFALERCLIEYLTQQGNVDAAREAWAKLVKSHGDYYDFWQQYYEWEMIVELEDPRRPKATAVLKSAVVRRGLDWPEKLIEMYSRHCNLFSDADTLGSAMDFINRSQKGLAKRRQKEAAEAAALYVQQQEQYASSLPAVVESAVSDAPADSAEQSPGTKRKREDSVEAPSKKPKADNNSDHVVQEPKRDREHTSILVTNLPPEVTQTKVKQFFREYGHVNNLELVKGEGEKPSTALIEFRSLEDVQSALLRNDKFFGEHQIKVVPAKDLTLYVTNFPIAEDENDAFMYERFSTYGEIFPPRWPNKKKKLLANQRRRFAYISFTTSEGAAKALELDGKEFNDSRGHYKMEVKYSNPFIKKEREPSKRPPKPKFDVPKTPNGADPTSPANVEGSTNGEEKPGPVKPAPKLMQQAPIRRPVLGGASKKKRGGFGAG